MILKAHHDSNTSKIDVSIGSYFDENGRTGVFDFVKEAEKEVIEMDFDKVHTI